MPKQAANFLVENLFFSYKEQERILVTDYLQILKNNKIDFTNGFRKLSKKLYQSIDDNEKNNIEHDWYKKWNQRLLEQRIDVKKVANNMNEVNPVFIPRNHIVTDIIQQSVHNKDYRKLKEFLKALRNPFIEKKEHNAYYAPAESDKRVVNTFCGT